MSLDHSQVGSHRAGAVLVHLPSGLEGEQPRRLDLGMGQRDVVLDHLVLCEQLAMRPSRYGTLAHDVERSLRLTEPTHRVVDTAPAETLLSQDEPIAWRTNQMVGRNTAAPKHELGMVPDLTEF